MLLIFIISILKLGLIKSLTVNELFEDTSTYINDICSHNGIPKLDGKQIICECNDKYANEPREKYKKYINGQLIQCSYRKKKKIFDIFSCRYISFWSRLFLFRTLLHLFYNNNL